ncbi:anti-repressor SinI family protein [Ammoniphilus oxalaticus]|nr:anti-repressor SinI family protein [Ammoniphilus oxalaticus]
MVKKEKDKDMLDQEWVNLILEAKEIGISKEEIRDFLIHKMSISI